MKIFIIIIFCFTISSALAKQSAKNWDGKFDHINCGTAEECKGVASALNHQNRFLDAMPYMAHACIKGGYFCTLIGMRLSNKDQAYAWHKRNCDKKKSPDSCYMAISYLAEKNPKLAKEIYQQVCTNSNDLSCRYGILKKDVYGRKMVEESCKEGHHVSCNISIQFQK